MKNTALASFLFTLLLPLTTRANPVERLQWVELEPGTLVTLLDPLRVSTELEINPGSRFAVNAAEPLPGIKVQILRLRLYPCPAPLDEKRIPMTILETGQGFEMEKGCQVNLYHEFNEFYRPSPFGRSDQ
jgi:hypothetical protein